MPKFCIVIEGDDNGRTDQLSKDGAAAAQATSDRLRQQGYLVSATRFSRGGHEEPQSTEARREAKAKARKEAEAAEAARVKAENEAAKKNA